MEVITDAFALLGLVFIAGLWTYTEHHLTCRTGNHRWNGNVCEKCGLVKKPVTVRKK